MTPERESLKECEAREWLGVSQRRWTALKKTGRVKPHPVTGTYLVDDLRRLLAEGRDDEADSEKGRAVPSVGEGKAGTQGANIGHKADGGRGPKLREGAATRIREYPRPSRLVS
jgi:hypothetical protein